MEWAACVSPDALLFAPMRMNHVGIRVSDLERSLGFHKEVLGLTEVRRGDMRECGRGIWVLLQDAGTGEKLELNWYPSGSSFAVPYIPGKGLNHIGFQVDDVEESYRELSAKGAEAAGVGPQLTAGWQAYLKDPDDNWIELYK